MAFHRDRQQFEVRNSDISLRFSCPNYGKRIAECVHNLQIDEDDEENGERLLSFFGSQDDDVQFRFDHEGEWVSSEKIIKTQAYLFENTDYPVRVLPRNDKGNIVLKRLLIGKETNDQVAAEDEIIFGRINFHNQVGHTDIKVVYIKDGEQRSMTFSTEVLSYKMDYRTDMRQVIKDIENEFAMLSYAFLKQTYLTFRESHTDSPDLIWWQIFRDCYTKIVEAANYIINRPKRRLKSEVRYERAERMPFIPIELENEYAEFCNRPGYLYRFEEMYLSKDTVENRFLKYAILSIANRFKKVQQNVLAVLKADNLDMRDQIAAMNKELDRLSMHPFFRGIGSFKGFSQDSLVMKQAAGYKDIYENWIILQCGYELQEGIMQLEVKDISDLYEIWCFIKIKNIVKHILKDKAYLHVDGDLIKGDFVKKLVKGKSSVIHFIENEKDIELASIMYNATSDDRASDQFDPSKNTTDIEGTTSMTTEQRPDIVLRLSKSNRNNVMVYTYLFDAKYRLNDTPIWGRDVPPTEAINQLHRYRDAIFYTQSADHQLKREIIGGYVLYPGNLNAEQFIDSYYHKSIKEVNIGAFPLKPGGHWHEISDKDLLDESCSEDVLYKEIKAWLEDESSHLTLLNRSIPQKGLKYSI